MRNFLVILSLCTGVAFGQPLQFDNLTSNDGLPQNSVSAFLEDTQGFIWIGTRHGLCRYDGTSFRQYVQKDSNDNTPYWNINDLAQDKHGNIWVGYANKYGLSIYYYKKDKWLNFPRDSTAAHGPANWYVSDIFVTANNEIWFASGQYLQQVAYKADSFEFRSYPLVPDPKKSTSAIYQLVEGSNGDLWLATSIGLVCFDRTRRKMIYDPVQLNADVTKRVFSLHAGRDGRLWVGLAAGGAAVLPAGKWEPGIDFQIISGWPFPSGDASVFSILEASGGDIHFATTSGLVTYSPHKNKYIVSRHVEGNDRSLANNRIDPLLEDAAGNLWIGSERGLSRFFRHDHIFYQLTSKTFSDKLEDRITRILVDKDGFIWSGGEQLIQRISLNDTGVINIKSPNMVSGLLDDNKGNIWAVMVNWLLRIRKSDLSVEKIPIHYTKDLTDKEITAMTIDPTSGNIWLGGASEIFCFNPSTYTWRNAVVGYRAFFTGLDITPDGRIFAADAFFLFEIDKEKMEIRSLERNGNGLRNKTPYLDLTKDIHYLGGKIYIAQTSGLVIYDVYKNTWRDLHQQDGLSSEGLRAITSDKQGNVWISSNNGLTRLDKKDKLTQFTNAKLLPALEFNSRAKARDIAGNIYFGTDKGLVYFDPRQFSANSYRPPVRFTKFELFNKEVAVDNRLAKKKDEFFLQKAIQFTPRIDLDYNHSVFSVSFAALNFLHPEKNTYTHRLVGFDEDWVFDGTKNNVTYTNLEPGEYELQVKAANNDNVWSDEIASIKITVAPPWYKTWWAYLCYLVGIIAVLWLIIRYRIEQVRKQSAINDAELRARTAEAEKKAIEMESLSVVEKARLQEREAMRKKSAQDFHDEAGIKLSRIGLLTTVARQNVKNEELAQYLNKIEENAQDLSSSMRDFIWVLDPEQDTFYAILQRLQDFGNKIFEYSGIEFKSYGVAPSWQNYMLTFEEKRHIMLIFKEAMNNALKYSRAKVVVLSVDESAGIITVSLQDNGEGFDVGRRTDSYGIRNMQSRAAKINAHLAILTSPGNGVKIKLELKKRAVVANEIEDNPIHQEI